MSPPSDPTGPQFHSRSGDGERRPLRSYSPTTGQKDVDQYERVIRLRALIWSFAGGIMGGLLGVFSVVAGDRGIWIVPVCAFAGWGVAFWGPLWFAGLAGRAAGNIHNPSGRTTPPKREYSQAESLVARGMYKEAVSAFEIALPESNGKDPTPYLRIARTYRDHLDRMDDAERWFKRALKDAEMPPGQRQLTRRELVELYTGKMARPEKAAPLLARLAEEAAGTPEGKWAAAELKAVKERMMRGEETSDGEMTP